MAFFPPAAAYLCREYVREVCRESRVCLLLMCGLNRVGKNHVLQVNKRVIEKRKGRGLFARLWPVRSDISSQAAAAPPSITPGGL